ncbi:kinase-like domain-containing protein [Lipomyces arxii]|uniref:kinase-like domain-containing protein n=1 Tax=Lipomyces arxii TaxID=56418 RepID=UPI0034CFAE2B
MNIPPLVYTSSSSSSFSSSPPPSPVYSYVPPVLVRQKPFEPETPKRSSKENWLPQSKRTKLSHAKQRKVVVVCEKLGGHVLPAEFLSRYLVGDELGSGGFGFVMSATRYSTGEEVAVKFIYRHKVPQHSWVHDPVHGAVPAEVYVLLRTSRTPHQSIIRLYEYFADEQYFVLVTELHGTPWSRSGVSKREPLGNVCANAQNAQNAQDVVMDDGDLDTESDEPEIRYSQKRESHDLFEMIETRRSLSERQVRYVIRQLVDALWFLDSLNIYHRDIKDENILIDDTLKIKLIDFGSAVVLPQTPSTPTTPTTPSGRVQFNRFYGTMQYAPVEVLKSQPYDAEKSDVWALGILVYTCLTGKTPFRSAEDAIANKWTLKRAVSPECTKFIDRCLDKNPDSRASIYELVRERWWLVDLP